MTHLTMNSSFSFVMRAFALQPCCNTPFDVAFTMLRLLTVLSRLATLSHWSRSNLLLHVLDCSSKEPACFFQGAKITDSVHFLQYFIRDVCTSDIMHDCHAFSVFKFSGLKMFSTKAVGFLALFLFTTIFFYSSSKLFYSNTINL